MAYVATANRVDRAKAISGVALVHVLLALMILFGLNLRRVGETIEHLRTFDVVELPPPPPVKPPPPKPALRPRQMKKPAGAPAKQAEPSPIVAPEPKLPLPSPIPAARVAGAGNASTSGAGTSGTGTGADGTGNGPGGGGDFSRFTPARQIATIPDREYRKLAATGVSNGTIGVSIHVNADGRVSNCRVIAS